MKVIVIGAGISGLAAAYTLKKHNIDTIVLEKSDAPGGRTSGERKDGVVIDHGAQFFMGCYKTTRSLVKELGMESDIVREKHKPMLWHNGKLIPNPPTSPRHILRWFRTPSSVIKGQLQTAKLFCNIFNDRKSLNFTDYENALSLDEECFSDFVLRLGGKEALDHTFQPLISGLTLGIPEEISALYGASLFWNLTRGNWILKGGIYSLADRLYSEIKPVVRLSTPATRIVVSGKKIIGVETAQGFMEADAVVSATTASAALATMVDFPRSVRSILEKVEYRACCHVVFSYDRRVLPKGCNLVALPRRSGSSMSCFADSARTTENYAPKNTSVLHCYVYDHFAYEFNEMSDHEIISRLQSELRTIIPSIPQEYLFCEICRWEEAMCFSTPGMHRAVSQIKKNNCNAPEEIYFSGDYLNLASVEGSAKSGVDAALAILRKTAATL